MRPKPRVGNGARELAAKFNIRSSRRTSQQAFSRCFQQYVAHCADEAPLAAAPGVVVTAGSLDVAAGLLAGIASLARLAASLVPGVPFNPAELLITPLLPELMVSLLLSSTFLQPVAAVASAAIDTINRTCFRFSFIALSAKGGARAPHL
jgi:hypothetical protein